MAVPACRDLKCSFLVAFGLLNCFAQHIDGKVALNQQVPASVSNSLLTWAAEVVVIAAPAITRYRLRIKLELKVRL